jgi:uncharacterized protein YlxW (UPF0749 family)/beta-lactamase regulating signal transducer with metallopeptidase domain
MANTGELMSILWKVSLQAGILAALVWIVARLAKNGPARLRHTLWALVLIKFLVPPFAHFPAEWAFWQKAVVSAPMPSELVASAPSHYVQPKPSLPRVSSVASEEPTVAVSRNLPAVHEPTQIDWLLCLWLAGVGIMLLALVIRWLRQRRMVSSSVAADGDMLEALRGASQRLRMRGLPDLRISDLAATPMVVGLLRQTILLPREISTSCGEADLQAMLLHELAHVKRRDMLVLWLQQLAQVVFFFHPAIWLTSRELKRERELACDELVLSASGIAPKDYAAGYVAALRLATASSPMSLAMAEPSEIEKRRLEAMLRNAIPKLTVGWVAAVVLVAAVGLVTFSGVRAKHEAQVTSTDQGKAMVQRGIELMVGGQVEDAKILVGTTPVEGEGVILTLQDSKQVPKAPAGSSPEKRLEIQQSGIVHDSDVRLVIDELFSAGAEAIAVNDQRVVTRTAVRCVGPSIQVNDVKMGSPFIIRGIGSSKEMMAALETPGGLMDNDFKTLKMIMAKPSSHIVLPAYSGSMRVRYAKVAK